MTHRTNYSPGTVVLLVALPEDGRPEEIAVIQEKQEEYNGMYSISINGEDCEVHEDQILGEVAH